MLVVEGVVRGDNGGNPLTVAWLTINHHHDMIVACWTTVSNTMRQGDRFSDERVREIKRALLRGTHPRVIARIEGVMLNTIIRLRDGDTYASVKVEGEEGLRRGVDVRDYDPSAPQCATRDLPARVVPISEEEVDKMERELLEYAAGKGKGEPTRATDAALAMLGQRPEGK